MHALLFAAALTLSPTKLHAHDAATALTVLRGISIDDDSQTTVPADAALLMTNAKRELRALVTDAVQSQDASNPLAASRVKAMIIAALAGEEIASEEEPCDTCSTYGLVESVAVNAPADDHDDLLAVEIVLSIPCGSDSVFYLFRHDESSWQLVFQRQEDGYESIADALGGFEWRLGPSAADGSFLIVTTTISPWCISMWQRLTYTADRIVPHSDQPRAIDRGTSSIYLDDDLVSNVTAGGYSLHFTSDSSLEPGFTRTYRLNYKVVDDRPQRIDPVADSPRDFVEEWLTLSDDAAARWSDLAPEQRTSWRKALIHEETYRSVGAIRQCVDGLWQVHVDDDEREQPLYFVVSNDDGAYRMKEIRNEPRNGCPDEPEATGDAASPSPSEAQHDQS
jgi:hypothetical protein